MLKLYVCLCVITKKKTIELSNVFFLSLLAQDGVVAGWNFTTRGENGAGGEEALTAGWPPVHHLHRNIMSEWRSFRPRPHLSSFGSRRDFF